MVELILPDKYIEQEELQWFIDLNLAFLQGRWDVVDQHLTEDVHWHIIGNKSLQGRKKFLQFLQGMETPDARSMQFDQIWRDGPEIIARGSISLENGAVFSFADFYVFEHKKIKSLTSFVIQLSSEGNEQHPG